MRIRYEVQQYTESNGAGWWRTEATYHVNIDHGGLTTDETARELAFKTAGQIQWKGPGESRVRVVRITQETVTPTDQPAR